ncbi:MAG TPA: enolase C-terminal domain-like protein, partial [Myxococcaceae bacterium]|nr:enolase C-terminal domain-like protein [Myxococcaceae bacterium]
MKPSGAGLRRCAAPLPATVRNARGEWHRRESVLLRVYDTDGRIGQGEASPLPGYSPDTVEACAAALWAVPWAELPAIETQQEATEVAHRIDARLPAARFALETALLDLLGQAKQRSLPRMLGVPPDRPVPLCALLQSENLVDQEVEVREHLRRGIHCFKRKLLGTHSSGRRKDLYPERRGGSPDRAALALLTALRKEAPTAEIRVDANGALLATEVGGTLRALSAIAPEWLEEPTSAWEALEASPVPLAFDETLQD